MAFLVSLTCALLVTAALGDACESGECMKGDGFNDLEEAQKVSLLQTGLRRLYQNKGSSSPQPSKTFLLMESPHTRSDNSPAYAASLLEHHTHASLLQSKGTNLSLIVETDNNTLSGRTKVQSDFIGLAVWRRFDTNEIPSHAFIKSAQSAYNILNAAPGAAAGAKTGEVAYSDMTTSSRNTVRSAASSIRSNGVNSCYHDVYASVLIGQNNGRRRRKVFGPGLNQMWVTFNPSYGSMLGYIVVGAAAAGDAAALYPGGGSGDMQATMSFSFTDFSDERNPIKYKVSIGSDGFPDLDMRISHHENNQQYIRTRVHFDAPSTSNQRSYVNTWTTTSQAEAFDNELFMTKAFQIYSICHCYHGSSQAIYDCLTNADNTGFWNGIVSEAIVGLVDNIFPPPDNMFNPGTKPRYLENGRWTICWDSTPNAFQRALRGTLTVVIVIVEEAKEFFEDVATVGTAVVNEIASWFR